MEYKEITAKSILNRLRIADDWFQCSYTMNIYRGCEHGCRYCDGRSEKHWPDGGNVAFSEVVMIKENAPALLDKELLKIRKKQVICLGGGVNDSYQPIEKERGITRKCLEVIRDHGFPVHLMTKSTLIERDMDILKEISDKTWCNVSVSFSTPDERTARLLEPGCPSPKDRFRTIKRLNRKGIRTGVAFMPVMPYISDTPEETERMFKMAKDAHAGYILDSPLTLRDYQKEYFLSFMEGTRLKRFLKRYERLYRKGDTPATGYFRKINRIMFDLSMKYGIPRSMPEFIGKESQTRLITQ